MLNLENLGSEVSQKIYNILEATLECYELKPSNQGRIIVPQEKFKDIGLKEAVSIIHSLEEKTGVLRYFPKENLKLLKQIKEMESENKAGIVNGKDYELYLQADSADHPIIVQNPTALKKLMQRISNKQLEKTNVSNKNNEIAYEAKYNESTREIRINGHLIAKPNFNSENELTFDYLYKNSNKRVSKEEIEKYVGDKLKKPIHSIIRDLGFTGKLAKAFFNASQKGVFFRNPITRENLRELQIDESEIDPKITGKNKKQ